MIDSSFVEKISSDNNEDVKKAILEIINAEGKFDSEEIDLIIAVIEPHKQSSDPLTANLAATALKKLEKWKSPNAELVNSSLKKINQFSEFIGSHAKNIPQRLKSFREKYGPELGAKLSKYKPPLKPLLIFAGLILLVTVFIYFSIDRPVLLWKFNWSAETGEIGSKCAGGEILNEVVAIDAEKDAGKLLFVLDKHTGKELWRVKRKECYGSKYNKDFMFVWDEFRLSAHNPTDGKRIWEFQTPFRETSFGFDNESLFVGNHDGIYALDSKTGKEKWVHNTSQPGNSFFQGASESNVFFSKRSDLFALDKASGKLKWSFPFDSWNPHLVGDFLFFGNGKEIVSINETTGNLKWRSSTIGYAVSVEFIHRGMAICRSFDFGGFVALDLDSGQEKWRLLRRYKNTLNFSPENGILVMEDREIPDHLFGIDCSSGKEIWKIKQKIRPPVCISSNSVIFCSSNNLIAHDISSGKEKWRLQLNEGGYFRAFDNGIVLVSDKEHLYAYKAR